MNSILRLLKKPCTQQLLWFYWLAHLYSGCILGERNERTRTNTALRRRVFYRAITWFSYMGAQMNELESTRAKLKCLEMVAGTDLKWWEVIKLRGYVRDGGVDFGATEKEYELALCIVEGKPVWAGDELYWTGDSPSKEVVDSGHNLKLPEWSWNPPKPKTVIVELPISEARHLSRYLNDSYNESRIAIKKALEEMK